MTHQTRFVCEPQRQLGNVRAPFPLVPGEKLVECPYNASHKVLDTKFSNHVRKCRLQHIKEQESKGEPSKFSVCQYSPVHHVLNEALEEHQKECPVGKYIRKQENAVGPCPWAQTMETLEQCVQRFDLEDAFDEIWESEDCDTFDFKQREKEMEFWKQPKGLTKIEKETRLAKIKEMRHPRAQELADAEWEQEDTSEEPAGRYSKAQEPTDVKVQESSVAFEVPNVPLKGKGRGSFKF